MTTTDRLVLAGAAGALLVAAVAAWLLIVPIGEAALDEPSLLASPIADQLIDDPPAEAPSTLVIDVEGGVQRPGIQQLPAGSRVADAIAAAGGYGPRADLIAAASAINLAQPLVDGQQIYVPLVGETAAGGGSGGAGGGGDPGGDGGAGGLVNLNTATPEQLEALPGIGPVTVQKIVAGREERPFTSLEDALARKVIDRGQIEKIRDLATAS